MGIDLGRFKSKSNDEWLDWLADDPVPATIRARMRKKAVEQASRPVVRRPGQPVMHSQQVVTSNPKNTENAAVSIHISIPKFKKPTLPKKLRTKLTYKRVGAGAGILILVVSIGVLTAVTKHNKKPNTTTGVLSTTDEKPAFQTLSPTGTTGGTPSEMRYNPEHKIVTFVDSIGGVNINVTEQALPDSFKDNTDDKVKKLAEGFSANEVLSTANPTAYLGTSIDGPQSVIFHKNGLLIFIKSKKKIDNHDWAEYITNLK